MRTTTAVRKKPIELAPRERILEAACQLFYLRGIRNVSVDEIAAAAQTNKMTLYRHFESKDLLVAEYLKKLAQHGESLHQDLERANPGNAYGQLRAWIEFVSKKLNSVQDRGCPMANAAVEIPEKGHPARAVIEEYKTRQRERMVRVCREAGFVEPERLADELFLIFEGACINVQSVGNCGPGCRFAEMASRLIDSHARSTSKPSRTVSRHP
jgi:AcrR family transcriptional regulator